MCRQLVRAAQEVYGLEARKLTLSDADRAAIAALREHYAGRDWRFGANVPASFACEGSFSWGNVSLELQVEQGSIARAALYTDAMEWELSALLKQALEGCAFSRTAMQEALAALPIQPAIREDLSRMLAEQEI